MLDYERVGMAELGWWADWWLLFPVSQDVGNASFVIVVVFLGCLYGLCLGCGLMVLLFVCYQVGLLHRAVALFLCL